MPLHPQDPYTPYPTVQAEGGGGRPFEMNVNPDQFGAQVGGALSDAGKTGEELGNKYLTMATEARVQDDYANKYAPAAAQLRSQYDSLRGQDKIAGYDTYISGLQALNKQFTGGNGNPYGKQLIGGLIDRHIAGEIDGAKRELVASQKQFSDQSTFDLIKANTDTATNGYNDPELVSSTIQNNNALITKHSIDNGIDPTTPQGAAAIQSTQKAATGTLATSMINRAVASGDVATANKIRSDLGFSLPGYQQVHIDNILHTETVRQTSYNTVQALKSGAPIPEGPGLVPSQAKATVADTASASGLDPNHALTVLQIESAGGTNLGTRGTIGQDKGSAGKPLSDQAQALCDNLKIADAKADEVLGRKSEGWEGYTVYQQGVGGGAALLKADPNTKAIDVLTPLYKNKQEAASAITGNGGNLTMTTGDFLGHIQNVYIQKAKEAGCDFNGTASPGTQITAPHTTGGDTVQPAATPTQALINWNDKIPGMMQRINSIPNIEVRQGVMERFKVENENINAAAHAYKANLVTKASQMAADPGFVSMDQMPAEQQSALATESPMTLPYVEKRAEYNRKHMDNLVSRDEGELGSGFYKTLDRVYADPSNPEAITELSQLQEKVAQGELSIQGYDALSAELQKKNTPAGQAELSGKKNLLAVGKSQISGQNEGLFVNDPKGEKLFTQWMALTLSSYKQGIAAGKTPSQLLSPDSSDYLGKTIPSFQRSTAQMTKDMVMGGTTVTKSDYLGNNPATRSLMDIARDIKSGKITLEQGKAEEARMNSKTATPVKPAVDSTLRAPVPGQTEAD